ncbi:class III extradiol dioxygenase subunit B-like domain-containing protein [Micromonospora sp. WMMD987]|uniref:class III extradiol dioxygenase subunit B-like domain-containing protein n=1 Tax=Micromonospora sp. WMMD987 TaxID=3016089 RepID=UPI00249A4DEF|nr:class III extradiol dioxygenase subunit B-like domain-containing protein [Micromonospora sp. WMMD987]WFE97006.1 class III extradiol dioxygenase subunit B-like domain-containing protein [Micromonospora sp. WMMD987]
MPLVAAAVCPHPPLIVPELAGTAAPELADLRAACAVAVTALYAAGARTVVLVGSGEHTAELEPPYRGSFTPWGLPRTVSLGPGPTGPEPGSAPVLPGSVAAHPGPPGPGSAAGLRAPGAGLRGGSGELPLSLLVGAWLVDRVEPPVPTAWRMVSVAPDASVDRCAALGAGLVANGPVSDGPVSDGPWALLVLGDGSACHGPKAPGYDDPRAGAYDEGVARALAGADVDALLGLDPVVSAELRVAGRAAWQVLAGAVRAAGGDWHGELRHHSAPYGVGYLVASWTRTDGRVR